MKKIFQKLIPALVFLVLVVPAVALAQASIPAPSNGGLIPCGRISAGQQNCTFDDLIKLINNLVNFILVYISVPIAAIMFAYAGILLIFSGDNEHSRSEAKSIFFNAVIGLVFIAGSWLIIHAVLAILGYTDASWLGF